MNTIVDPLEAARAALVALHRTKSWAFRDASGDAIDDAVGVGPRRLLLTSHYEERGVRYRVRKPSKRSEQEADAPDPWSVELTHAGDATVGAEISKELADIDVVRPCPTCAGRKLRNCRRCAGSGRVRSGSGTNRSNVTCGSCSGAGSEHCSACDGTVFFYGLPTVWSRIGEADAVRVLEATELPLDVLFDVMDSGDSGVLLGEQSAQPSIERFEPPTPHGGYRDSARERDARLESSAAELLAAPGIPDGARMRRQHFELRMVPAWAIRFSGGREVLLYGDPPKCHPPTALRTPLYWSVRALPYMLVALAISAVVFYLV